MIVTKITPEQEDPVVHRHLNSLESFTPRSGFADRVMARVQVSVEQEDAALDQYFASLESFAPRAGFADRVMARVAVSVEQEESVLDQYLASLESFAPRAGFADRVLAQVEVTVEPAWLLEIKEIKSTLFDRQTRWVWAAGAAASAVFSGMVYSSVAATNWPSVQAAWSSVTATLGSVNASSSTSLLSLVDTFVSVEGALPVAIAGSALMMFGCAFGLRRTIRDFHAHRVPISAIS
jgi:hypothetical protein